ncbi:hypothetical protein ACWDWU_20400 [Streptomyces sp. NPDC003442]
MRPRVRPRPGRFALRDDLGRRRTAIAGLGQGAYAGVDYALVVSVLPDSETEAAKGMGLFSIANALPQSVAPAIAPAFLTIGGGSNYAVLYLSAAAFALPGAFAVMFVKETR